MRPLPLVSPILLLLLTPVLTSVGEDAQVIQSPKSVLTIYSYGLGETRRFTPDMPDHKPGTGALSDVVTSPPLSASVRLRAPQASTAEPRFAPAEPTTTTSGARTSKMMSATSSMQSNLTIMPVTPAMVSVGWQPSPDESVVGYNLYVGTASHQYTNRQTLGNQTVTQLPANSQTLYIAVSAYTALGLESRLSDELTLLPATGEQTSATSRVIGAGAGAN